MKQLVKLLTLLVVITLVLVACGGGEATPVAEEPEPTEEPAAAEPTEEPVAEEPATEEPALEKGDVIFFSTQFVPIEEQEKFRAILADGGFDFTGSEEGCRLFSIFSLRGRNVSGRP